MRYLTVQDVLWINSQVTKATQTFKLDPLDEATYYQYGYGKSQDVLGQAQRFLTGFAKIAPFSAGNLATIFVAVITFLNLNGHDLDASDDDAKKWFDLAVSGGLDLFRSRVEQEDGHHHGDPETKDIVEKVLGRFPKTIASLVSDR